MPKNEPRFGEVQLKTCCLFHQCVTVWMRLFNREGVQWDAIDWMDNAECLDLIEKV